MGLPSDQAAEGSAPQSQANDTGLNSAIASASGQAQAFLDQVNSIQTDLGSRLMVSEMLLALVRQERDALIIERDALREQPNDCEEEENDEPEDNPCDSPAGMSGDIPGCY